MEEAEWIPRVGMEFETTESAWDFWNKYAGKIGFNARKGYNNHSYLDGRTTSRAFLCSSEGFRPIDKRDETQRQVKLPRHVTRTGCPARMVVKLNKVSDKYEVKTFVNDHNHMLQQPQACYLLSSQRKVSEVAAYNIDLAHDSGISPKAAHTLMGCHAGSIRSIGHTLLDQYNYLRDKRNLSLVHGEANSILRYFCQQVDDNPSFQHAEQIENQEIGNIFWADAQMVIDYAQFGEVIIFDTTHGTNKEYRPFGVFVGLNHFREIIIFGAVLLYDQCKESFEWVFDTFLKAHNNKRPKTIFTDQDAAMGAALAKVMLNTTHNLCCWHIMENATKKLLCHNKGETDFVGKFRACVYVYEEEEDFKEAFIDLESKIGGPWFPIIYKDKEKWAYCYRKDVFSLGVQSTQLSESLNKDLKNYLKSDLNIIEFFKQFERVVAEKREKENMSDFHCRGKLPRIKMDVPILLQMSNLYTPKIFEIFQLEYELAGAMKIQARTENEYIVSKYETGEGGVCSKSFKVTWNSIDELVLCSCKKFERWGILCSHALKLLDFLNIKLLPEKYILKRWTREARDTVVHDKNGEVVVDKKLEATRRNQDLCRRFTRIAAKASGSEELSTFLNGVLDNVEKHVHEKMSSIPNKSNNVEKQIDEVSTELQSLSQNPLRLKKKSGKKGSKRNPSWVEKLPKGNTKKKRTEKKGSTQQFSEINMASTVNKVLDVSDRACNPSTWMTSEGMSKEHQQHELDNSFTNLLMGYPSHILPLPSNGFQDSYLTQETGGQKDMFSYSEWL